MTDNLNASRFTVVLAATWLSLLAGCAPKGNPYLDPCRAMREEIKEMQSLEKDMKALAKQTEVYRKANDTAGVALAERRFAGMREHRRALQASLESSARDCNPTMRDPEPARDPVRREALPK